MNLNDIKKKHNQIKQYMDLRKYLFVLVLLTLLTFTLGQYILAMFMLIMCYLGLVLHDKYKNLIFE